MPDTFLIYFGRLLKIFYIIYLKYKKIAFKNIINTERGVAVKNFTHTIYSKVGWILAVHFFKSIL